MLKTGFALLGIGIVAMVVGLAAAESFRVPVPGGLHMTFYPFGIGLLMLIAGALLLAAAALMKRENNE